MTVNLKPAQAALWRVEQALLTAARELKAGAFNAPAAAAAIGAAVATAAAKLGDAPEAFAGAVAGHVATAQAHLAMLADADAPAAVLADLARHCLSAHDQLQSAANSLGATLLPQVSGLPKEQPPLDALALLSSLI